MCRTQLLMPVLLLLAACTLADALPGPVYALEPIRVSDDGTHFVRGADGKRFVVWGVNYDHDRQGRLLDEYWIDEWQTVVEDFREIKQLGANCVRIHLQLGMFMEAADRPNDAALRQLSRLVELAESTGLYLDVTGLACYHKQHVPDWYDELTEADRWSVQAAFWEAVARTCRHSPAIFCYDLMNEPILPGKEPASEWLAGELGGKFFVQRISLDARGRGRKELAAAWVNRLTGAIRKHDRDHLVTVGVIPWVFVFGGGEPLFYSPEVGQKLDFVSVHFYPEQGKIDAALEALKKYDVGKPLVVEEMFPLKSGIEGMQEFIAGSAAYTDGWISFYWGTPVEQLRASSDEPLRDALLASWLEKYRELSARYRVDVEAQGAAAK